METLQEHLQLGDGTGWSVISDQQKVSFMLFRKCLFMLFLECLIGCCPFFCRELSMH
ncbi:hypothetical protein LINGRAHAP2_LOCUS22541 [Linum grandiflorum]